MIRISLICLFGHSLFVLAGCGSEPAGPSIYPVSGTVTLDGTPVEGSSIEFVPITIRTEDGLGGSGSLGDSDAAGQYEMYTGRNLGVQDGEYTVKISKVRSVVADAATDTYEEKNLLPSKYAGEDSGLTASIKTEANTIDFELKTAED